MTLPAATPTPPTAADRALLGFANSAELAARDLYAVAASLPAFSKEEQTMLIGFHDHHLAAGQALAGLVGKDASNVREDAVYNAFRGKVMGSDKSAILDALRELENTLVSTHLSLVGMLEGTEGSALVASILSVQARHAAALALLGGRTITDALTNQAAPLAPETAS
ncbi:MAG: ferritin-like domain-containing protein [Actinomycetota bacterium]